ncbi:DNA topoisomerase 2-binding protein 1 isoform X1 [Cynara cardunculus var. scolymus]|uniref:DNA topoisomerase 2-binding protein 1 isoform X1 n=2 Tax=Cynara cardunculus var. scolymus TaxID=59895 RepID=UPI000D624034|nr:DNA topoisomerase 2-binding protein 1 isoform X1 [Cynara cardunculus var. scolymus]XP_024973373.1 DNA topoisomerase 2-binding protein 1 isoform X1 [Cynara cardunculus var. scolymus]
MMRKTTFKGANVFMSRNLVPPEIFDSLHDALKDNGADIFLCCDPSRNGPNDYHIISSRDHERFEDLREKGCNLLGPQCVLSCAKEHRVLPKQGFTCCLAMDGVKVLASGFEMEGKVEIGKLVTAMGGVLQTKASSDVSFVIVKNVLAAKYKWALNTLKKPIVSESWLHQCWKEHRVVPHESYRVLPFFGLTISVTQVPLDARKEIEKLVLQNGGKYSAELTRKSTHLVCDAPEGDKYKVAKRWGHIHIVTRAWFDQSVARRACLSEESYPVQRSPVTSMNSQRTSLTVQRSQDKVTRNSQCGPHSMTHQEISCDGMADADLEATLSQNMASTFSDIPIFINEDNRVPSIQPKSSVNIDGCVAKDSQSEDNDLYLLNCKIHLVGFDASEMRRLVNMVRRGAGSRYMSLNEQLTHIVVGTPSETEKKEVRSLSAMGVINVVRTVWLEDCEREKKEIPVLRRHVAYDLLLPKDSTSFSKGSVSAIPGPKQGNLSTLQPILPSDQSQSFNKGQQTVQHGIRNESQDNVSSVFRGRSFRFSSSFPDVQRAEIVDWIHEGGGEVVDTRAEKTVNYTVETHGVLCSPSQFSGVTNVSSHWIRSCLQDGYLLDVSSHILFSPLQCKVPLPGFIGLHFCVSQYEEKDRELLRNLCHILGGRLVNRLTKKVNYLICKFTEGPKYVAACEWGIQTVTIKWIWECVKQNKIVASGQFLPKEATISDREAGMCTTSQYPTQAVGMVSAARSSELASQSQDPKTVDGQVDTRAFIARKEVKYSVMCGKRSRLSEDRSSHEDPVIPTETNITGNGGDVSKSVPDVAAAIEDLLEQTSKIHDQKSPERRTAEKNVSEVFTSDCSRLGHDQNPHSAFGLSKHWTRRSNEKDDITNPGGEENTGIYGGFSETQTESQVVSYEEDLSGRQMIIDRVRTRSGLTPNPSSLT